MVWRGELPETGERAMLMLWSNALLTGYFACNGKISTVESLGGGVNAFAELDRRRLPSDHPDLGAEGATAFWGRGTSGRGFWST